jgi:quercetin dioxygenase-like cupin family protein
MPAFAIEECPPATHKAHNPSRYYTHNGVTINVQATSAETNHTHSLIELTIPAHFPGAPLHYHQTFIESFYVLEGQIRAFRGEESFAATPGTLIHMPIGIVHGYHNETNAPARFLVISTPGGFDTFFTDLIAWMKREPQSPPTDRGQLAAFGIQHDTYYV